MGVESKLSRFAHETTDCCQIETQSVLSTGDIHSLDRRRHLVCPTPEFRICFAPARMAIRTIAVTAAIWPVRPLGGWPRAHRSGPSHSWPSPRY
ncbi:MAG: hypothetical protein JWP25_7387 [Bradyrhizobium sp.]|jgi:hypothetical protein|nr:hypothetical protein [Bradyrhizobium sp.]